MAANVDPASAVANQSTQVVRLEIAAQQQVFNKKPLLEQIITYALFDNGTGKISGKNAATLRLVKKSWQNTVSTCLFNLKEPFFKLTLTKINSLAGADYVMKNGSKLLDQFVSKMKTDIDKALDGGTTPPPFSLHLHPDYFRRENYSSLQKCLTCCGSYLISLRLCFPTNPSMTFNFAPFSLPHLDRVSVHFSSHKILDWSVTGLPTNTTIYLIQSILTASPHLKSLHCGSTSIFSDTSFPTGFETLKLPDTVANIVVKCPMSIVTEWKFLVKNSLPRLTHLTLSEGLPITQGECLSANKLIYKIFQNIKTSLKFLELGDSDKIPGLFSLSTQQQAKRFPIKLHFPVMEKLVTLKITSSRWQISQSDGGGGGGDDQQQNRFKQLHELLPKLEHLSILNQADCSFRTWTDSGFSAVRFLSVSLVNNNLPKDDINYVMPFTVEKMQRIHFAFGNLNSLNITLCGGDKLIQSLQYLFSTMTWLERLYITVKGSNGLITCDDWDGLIIGTSKGMAKCMRENEADWEAIQLTESGSIPSLRKLTKLSSLHLIDKLSFSIAKDLNPSPSPLISDVAFHFSLLRMPKLKYLHMTGKFVASQKMKEEWTRLKETTIYYSK